jgi:peptidoglycan/xylan/chitin deacetylase (PgdA/CDA1 family)
VSVPRPASRPVAPLAPLALALGVVVLSGACLPSALGPTPTPIPSPTPVVTRPPAPTPAPTPAGPTPTPAPTFTSHTVARGETLTSIARRYKTTARSIAFWNRAAYPSLDPTSPRYAPDRIAAGWQLQVMPDTVYDESTETEAPSLSPTPLPSLVIPPVATPAAGSALVVSSGARGGNGVTLTIEVGGRTAVDDAVVAWLVDHQVPATLFLTGEAAATDAGTRVLALVAAHPDLLTVGNLTFDHRPLTGLTQKQVRDELTRTDSAIRDAIGTGSKPFARPPFGAHDRAVREAMSDAGFAYLVLWDVDTGDWRRTASGGPTAEDIVSRVVSRAQGGSIVLLHAGGESTLAAMPAIVDGLAAAGLQPVTLDRLLGVQRPA